jgi:hypothetical protein
MKKFPTNHQPDKDYAQSRVGWVATARQKPGILLFSSASSSRQPRAWQRNLGYLLFV